MSLPKYNSALFFFVFLIKRKKQNENSNNDTWLKDFWFEVIDILFVVRLVIKAKQSLGVY